jgi:hypothetical protein
LVFEPVVRPSQRSLSERRGGPSDGDLDRPAVLIAVEVRSLARIGRSR